MIIADENERLDAAGGRSLQAAGKESTVRAQPLGEREWPDRLAKPVEAATELVCPRRTRPSESRPSCIEPFGEACARHDRSPETSSSTAGCWAETGAGVGGRTGSLLSVGAAEPRQRASSTSIAA